MCEEPAQGDLLALAAREGARLGAPGARAGENCKRGKALDEDPLSRLALYISFSLR